MKQNSERREFLKTLCRWTILGTLLFGGFEHLSFQKKINDKCVSDGICSQCSSLRGCEHPSALSLKESKQKK
jgi:hypothetical protein